MRSEPWSPLLSFVLAGQRCNIAHVIVDVVRISTRIVISNVVLEDLICYMGEFWFFRQRASQHEAPIAKNNCFRVQVGPVTRTDEREVPVLVATLLRYGLLDGCSALALHFFTKLRRFGTVNGLGNALGPDVVRLLFGRQR